MRFLISYKCPFWWFSDVGSTVTFYCALPPRIYDYGRIGLGPAVPVHQLGFLDLGPVPKDP